MKIENSNLHITIKTNLDKKHKINNFGSVGKRILKITQKN